MLEIHNLLRPHDAGCAHALCSARLRATRDRRALVVHIACDDCGATVEVRPDLSFAYCCEPRLVHGLAA